MNKELIKILKPLGVPVSFNFYKGSSTTYITFFTFLEQGELYGDSEELETGHYIQLDVFSKGDYSKLVEDVEKIMKENNYIRRYKTDAPYEADTGYYHKVLRYMKLKEE